MKSNFLKTTVAGIILSASTLATQAYAGSIDLNSWSQQGHAANGNWTVAPDGSSVVQSINGNPTFFVSPESFINKEFTGSFGVETTDDNDFVGFVFGYNGLDDFYLFDWKQGTQTYNGQVGYEGFTLSKISAGADVTSLNSLWDHNGTGVTVLDTDYGNDRGWADNTVYEFTLGYTDTEINIGINGGDFVNEQIFSISGLDNQAGHFGFYNMSQATVRYSGFEEDTCTENCGTVPEPSTLAIFALSLIGIGARRFKK
ncbi:PEP-CTERM sorting domain-containing protein [Thalassomonas haliotis]|uniref:PEP-CTERM sorting domain-containing protein n=1 Tax=Thalassomonas haliotis TaxID=485448 RepID=A0ABY7VFJ2_9GAMM|nr:PEP-CTERM sorting domain-containing protein [Thalassomonas haliotis]WDE12483.1 PEP-CTERM sorting domain-containing protein [Thalassomonas haliotis]